MNSIAKAFSQLSQVGINMVVTIGLGFFIGKWLDSVFNTNIVFLCIFTFLGIGGAFRNLYIMVIKDYKNQEAKEEKERELLHSKKDNSLED